MFRSRTASRTRSASEEKAAWQNQIWIEETIGSETTRNMRQGNKRPRYFAPKQSVKGNKRAKESPASEASKPAIQLVNELCPSLEYKFDDVKGPSHAPCFTVRVFYPPLDKEFVAIGASKKVAKNNVAERILKEVDPVMYKPAEVGPPTPPAVPEPEPGEESGEFEYDSMWAPPRKEKSYLVMNPFTPPKMSQPEGAHTEKQMVYSHHHVESIDFTSDDVEMCLYAPEVHDDVYAPYYGGQQSLINPVLLKRLEKIPNLNEQTCMALNLIASEPPEYKELSETGLPHQKTFTVSVKYGSMEEVLGTGSSKKRAKIDGARQMLMKLLGPDVYARMAEASAVGESATITTETVTTTVTVQQEIAMDVETLGEDTSHNTDPVKNEYSLAFSDYMHRMVLEKYEYLLKDEPDHLPQKVLAAIIMTTGNRFLETAEIVVLTTGTKCLEGGSMSESGCAVQDCHAEIIATRCFRNFIYEQLKALYLQGPEFSIFEKASDAHVPCRLKRDIRFHLYISTSPCGDARIFNPKGFVDITEAALSDPHINRSGRGVLRAKIEAGEGTIPVMNLPAVQQTWDAIIHGNGLNTMSCSDKVCRWNLLGAQGALLTTFIPPIYYSSVILGSLHHPVHFRRAIYGRLESTPTEKLPEGYVVNNAYRLMTSSEDTRRVRKSPNHAIVWSKLWPCYEVLNASAGRCKGNSGQSKICKRQVYKNYVELYQTVFKMAPPTCTYREAKLSAKDFQEAKKIFKDTMVTQGFGKWISKPLEVDSFIVEELVPVTHD